ncbi:electron transfer flavoprotein subunit alpha/FixB family protein [Pseudodesulfovibrio senegalensis]|jgi:electron transfer flavoprotein alpha subunit|uniref:Electron transfer flavoprotein subunit alpha n=1 Tax=Pseudodesulfovibrio senegalensis TaxID=1721087 RepID=A0A6N6N5T1_9BACT|nr:electron transfer flavoprotein subunit alpha [Pseudodesulfovibrio senegalensis]KAB1443386.1 electron transfer flavoprotein subunit alpha [Pseudodesulfovibrio senegalensis]
MSTILYLAHTEADGTLAKISREALTAAHQLAAGMGAELAVGLVGEDVGAAAESVAGCKARFLGVSGDAFSQGRYASDLAAAEALFKAVNPDMVVAPASFRFSRAIPGLAVRVQGRVDTHLTGLEAKDGKPVAKRWFYRQRMVGEFSRDERPWIVTVDAGCFEAFEESGSADVELVQVSLPEMRTTVTGIQAPDADEQTIRPDAKTLLVAGAGWTKKQADGQSHVDVAEEVLMQFLGATKASLGSSKSLVDISGEGQAVISFLTHLHQVGQTGSTPRHAKGLATCCHGEEPHVVGWRFINERRAINTDASCGWAQGKADVLYVADAFELMKKVNELL